MLHHVSQCVIVLPGSSSSREITHTQADAWATERSFNSSFPAKAFLAGPQRVIECFSAMSHSESREKL